MITGRNPWRRATTHDDHFHRFMSDPDEFLQTVLSLSEPACELIKGVFTFNPISRISLEEFREAVLAIDTFFLSTKETDSAKVCDKKVSDTPSIFNIYFHPKESLPATPELPQGVAEDFTSMHAYPDEEYLFSSPDPGAAYISPSSSVSTPSTILSPTSTLCDDDVDVFASECWNKLGNVEEKEAQLSPNPAYPTKHVDPSMSAALRLLERLVL